MTEHGWLEALAYAMGDLAHAEAASFELHMSDCDLCAQYLEEVRGVEVALGSSMAQMPPTALWEKVRREALRARPLPAPESEIGSFLQALHESGVHGACAFLNARTTHRFTGVYRLEAPVLRNAFLYDREQPTIPRGDDSPARETYCSIVLATGASFATADALTDTRLREHPARESVRSYFGVPLRRADQSRYGTLCHFDVVPRAIPHQERSLMEAAAPLVMRAIEGH